jgi:hypothetical protein
MKNTTTKTTLILTGLLLACSWPTTTHAQSEIAPDYFEPANMVPVAPAAPAKVDFQGSFSLPNQMQCSGNKLAPGQYTLAVKTEGSNRIVTIHRDGSDIVLTAHNVTKVSPAGQSVVLVRHGPGPQIWTLEGIYLENLNITLYLDESGSANPLDKMFASVKRVPIS